MYVERYLGKGEAIYAKAQVYNGSMISSWVFTVLSLLLCFISAFFLIFTAILLIVAISNTVSVLTTELVVTNKKVIGKVGLVSTKAMDAPLNKIQNVAVSSGLGGKIFGYGHINISTASGQFRFKNIKHPDDFKAVILNSIDKNEEDDVKKKAMEMAQAMLIAQQSQNFNNNN
ncbi:MAG: PH domain-containing protein [Acutalibacteraceae bacterium]